MSRRSPRPFTADEYAQIARLLDAGHSQRQIARLLDRDSASICRKFPGAGWSRERLIESLRKLNRERAKELLDQGCSYTEVARTLGVSRPTVARAFPGLGWSSAEAATFQNQVLGLVQKGQPR